MTTQYDDFDSDKVDKDENGEDKKKRRIIPLIILIIIALILALIFFFNRGEEETDGGNSGEVTSSSSIPSSEPDTVPVDPSTTRTEEPDVVTESTPAEEDEEETLFTGNAEPRYQEEPSTPIPTTGNEEAAELHMAPFDPAAGMPRWGSQFAVQNMFTMSPSKDVSYRDHFNESMEHLLSPQMKRVGFKPWWSPDEPEHTPYFQSLAGTPGAKIYNEAELKEERRTANDMMEYRYVVQPRVVSPSGYTNLADFEIIIQMIGNEEDNTWLMNDYYFPDGRVPPIH